MALNIKNKEPCELARELTDDTMTGAITVSLKEKIEDVKRQREHDRETTLREIRAIAKRCAARMGPGPSYDEIIESMYGEYGEPI